MSEQYKLLCIGFDVLDAAVNFHLEGYCEWGSFERTQPTPDSAVYVLTGNHGEALGRVLLRSVGGRSEIGVERPFDTKHSAYAQMVIDAMFSRLRGDGGIWQ
jgi:hypothetical protein